MGAKNYPKKTKWIGESEARFRKTFSILIFNSSKTHQIMIYQILLESYAAGEDINKEELSLLELELDSQLESIKFSRNQGCTEKAPKHIARLLKSAMVVVGSHALLKY